MTTSIDVTVRVFFLPCKSILSNQNQIQLDLLKCWRHCARSTFYCARFLFREHTCNKIQLRKKNFPETNIAVCSLTWRIYNEIRGEGMYMPVFIQNIYVSSAKGNFHDTKSFNLFYTRCIPLKTCIEIEQPLWLSLIKMSLHHD